MQIADGRWLIADRGLANCNRWLAVCQSTELARGYSVCRRVVAHLMCARINSASKPPQIFYAIRSEPTCRLRVGTIHRPLILLYTKVGNGKIELETSAVCPNFGSLSEHHGTAPILTVFMIINLDKRRRSCYDWRWRPNPRPLPSQGRGGSSPRVGEGSGERFS